MSDLDFRKQLLLNEFVTLSKGRSNSEMISLILAVSNKAKEAGIKFTKEDFEIIFKKYSPSLTEKELGLLPELFKILNSQ